ncbi:PREDICTED: stellacyanin [Tarenaya hassleriana]|uniref:stellacyanin n=1 Tax=Tarenaya hassleriana TaxID=28532 RepID=UPI00053C46D5|nr:PREDICTED: stellacyanin [Tarenaya hassleriana]
MGKTKLNTVNLWIICVIAATISICNGATYFVGDGSGWDISTDLDSWLLGKAFNVGDVLVFQYSSPHSVYEVTRDEFQSCNTTKPLRTFSGGNTTVSLSESGDRFFVCGNRLHCFAGMRLPVHIQGNSPSPSPSPAGAPQAAVSAVTHPSSKRNDPATPVPSSGAGDDRGIMGILVSTLFSLFLYNMV